MRTFLIFAIIILIFVLGYFQIIKIWNNVNFKFDFNIAGSNLTGLADGGTIKIPVIATITNDNSFSIPFRNVKAWIYYNNTLIAQTSDDISNFSFTAPAHGSIPVIDPSANLFVNSASIALLGAYSSHPPINYTISLTVFGIPFSYSDTFTA